MPKIVWDEPGDRTYESGIEKGVLYLPNGTGVPWNGLRTVVESNTRSSTPVYFDGTKVNDLVDLGSFAGTITAITYPDEFLELEGLKQMNRGVYVGDQQPKPFDLSYVTKVGNDVDGDSAGYKIHVLYNVTAIPSDKSYASLTTSASLTDFQWSISAVPEEIPGFRPTAHFIFDSRQVAPDFLVGLELLLYGGETANAKFPTLKELTDLILEFYLIEIVDNGDGTWTARSTLEGYITQTSDDEFTISNANITVVDIDTYKITDTRT